MPFFDLKDFFKSYQLLIDQIQNDALSFEELFERDISDMFDAILLQVDSQISTVMNQYETEFSIARTEIKSKQSVILKLLASSSDCVDWYQKTGIDTWKLPEKFDLNLIMDRFQMKFVETMLDKYPEFLEDRNQVSQIYQSIKKEIDNRDKIREKKEHSWDQSGQTNFETLHQDELAKPENSFNSDLLTQILETLYQDELHAEVKKPCNFDILKIFKEKLDQKTQNQQILESFQIYMSRASDQDTYRGASFLEKIRLILREVQNNQKKKPTVQSIYLSAQCGSLHDLKRCKPLQRTQGGFFQDFNLKKQPEIQKICVSQDEYACLIDFSSFLKSKMTASFRRHEIGPLFQEFSRQVKGVPKRMPDLFREIDERLNFPNYVNVEEIINFVKNSSHFEMMQQRESLKKT